MKSKKLILSQETVKVLDQGHEAPLSNMPTSTVRTSNKSKCC